MWKTVHGLGRGERLGLWRLLLIGSRRGDGTALIEQSQKQEKQLQQLPAVYHTSAQPAGPRRRFNVWPNEKDLTPPPPHI